jgi:hypothetical protein
MLVGGEPGEPSVGASETLSFVASPNASDALRERVTVGSAVVTGMSHALTRKNGARQTIELVAVSSDGATDPVSREEL